MIGLVTEDATFLVLHAGSDRGYRIARGLLQAGCRVAVTGRCVTDLARILPGYPAGQVLAIAASQSQLPRVISRVQARWGAIDVIIDADTGAEHGGRDSTPLEAA
ncbi:MAG: hypothetical protein JO044_16105 [Mycobacteriaceae bacterium]|nr:hypothetical protein [Mycobacteriaceae bacterium]MBV9638198.1 hypothetical protein [Mycobacteriaceae bacterium]